jgi:nucleotide-binding universal stress UspA family protein
MSFLPKHILVPVAIDPEYDLRLAEHAVLASCDIAEKFSSRITLLHLVPAISPGNSQASIDVSGQIYQAFLDVIEARTKQGRLAINELENLVRNRGIAVHGSVLDSVDRMADVILETADNLKVDLLVIGSHGRRGLSKLLFGSVAHSVAERASMPVLLLHPAIKSQKK